MTSILILFGIILAAYGLLVRAAGSGTNFFLVWIGLGSLSAAAGILFGNGRWKKLPLLLRRGILGVILLGLIVLIAVESLIISGFKSRGEDGLDYIIVLGAQVYRSGPSAVLKYRLDRAYEYLAENENTICIVTGGKGYNEPYAEAYGMRDYLVRRGVPEDRILMEDESANTLENIRNSLLYFNPETDRVGIVTNDFHVFRGHAIAKKAGIRNVCGISAGSNRLYLPNNLLRECLGVIKDTLCGNM